MNQQHDFDQCPRPRDDTPQPAGWKATLLVIGAALAGNAVLILIGREIGRMGGC